MQKLTRHDIRLLKIISNHGGDLADYIISLIFVDPEEIKDFEKKVWFNNKPQDKK